MDINAGSICELILMDGHDWLGPGDAGRARLREDKAVMPGMVA
jgi:hypothetical protein